MYTKCCSYVAKNLYDYDQPTERAQKNMLMKVLLLLLYGFPMQTQWT